VSVIERPVFFEGQILGAADLQAAVEHAAGQMARHERYLHLWGIATGLTLEATAVTTASGVSYVDVIIKSGVAIDGTGREIVLAEDKPLSEATFQDANVAVQPKPEDWFPVYLFGRDEAGQVPSFSAGACTSSQASRQVENVIVQFGRPGSAADLDKQKLLASASGPGSGAWLVLIGFVQWNTGISKFTKIGLSDDQGVGLRYAGVRADEVAARGGALTLRTRQRNQAGAPAMVIDETKGELRFGLQDQAGNIKSVFTLNAKGDIHTDGKIEAAIKPGTVQVQSGTAMDGVVLPLPPGVTAETIAPDKGKGTVHVQLTPRLDPRPLSLTPLPDQWGGFPLVCRVDDDRRVHCVIRWFKLFGANAGTFKDFPGLCDYLLVVAVPAADGGQ
jgi:hypothetical protein